MPKSIIQLLTLIDLRGEGSGLFLNNWRRREDFYNKILDIPGL